MGSQAKRLGLLEEAARAAGGARGQRSTFKEKAWVNPSRTLYITNVPGGTSTEELEKLFKPLDGFMALRRVRNMCFVDFKEKQQATSAMWATNGHRLSRSSQDGLLVSYDKDDSEERGGWSMRKKEEEKQRRLEADATRVLYKCSACGHFCIKLARPLEEMPERRTDGSRVVDTTVDLVALLCVKGGTKLLKREKGIEKQFRYNCELCDVCVAYRPVPYEQESKYIYVFPQAVVTMRQGSTVETKLTSESENDKSDGLVDDRLVDDRVGTKSPKNELPQEVEGSSVEKPADASTSKESVSCENADEKGSSILGPPPK